MPRVMTNRVFVWSLAIATLSWLTNCYTTSVSVRLFNEIRRYKWLSWLAVFFLSVLTKHPTRNSGWLSLQVTPGGRFTNRELHYLGRAYRGHAIALYICVHRNIGRENKRRISIRVSMARIGALRCQSAPSSNSSCRRSKITSKKSELEVIYRNLFTLVFIGTACIVT